MLCEGPAYMISSMFYLVRQFPGSMMSVIFIGVFFGNLVHSSDMMASGAGM